MAVDRAFALHIVGRIASDLYPKTQGEYEPLRVFTQGIYLILLV
jgi:hypothetical protein